LSNLCSAIGIEYSVYDNVDKIRDYMSSNKTTWALNVFESSQRVNYPEYIQKAVKWCDEQ